MKQQEQRLSLEKYIAAYSVAGKRGQLLDRLQLYRFVHDRLLTPRSRVLDVGCGEGFGPYVLSKKARECVGVDMFAPAVERANRVYGSGGVAYRAQDILSGPVADAPFDVVCALDVVEHVQDDAKFLERLRALAAPGGAVVVSTPNRLLSLLLTGGIYEFHEREYCWSEFVALIEGVFGGADFHCVNPGTLSRLSWKDRASARLVRRLPQRLKDALRLARFKATAPQEPAAWQGYVDALWETQHPVPILPSGECLPCEFASDYLAVVAV